MQENNENIADQPALDVASAANSKCAPMTIHRQIWARAHAPVHDAGGGIGVLPPRSCII